ncbi:hypothetical protein GCM10027598_61870 [Amycolatopsis oliviviridis]|uniref:Uncharacterized protein n=1 Tax=Amycolatopsis oliviviridis TaxID=1471590 RepID=A0ABQ3M3C0_9PSEU|nr:hypothetical protein GCM10017790_70160 [Amycolatopsis oliviviridis]
MENGGSVSVSPDPSGNCHPDDKNFAPDPDPDAKTMTAGQFRIDILPPSRYSGKRR